jgi:sec-independent protein translocase protein TatA
MGTLLFVSGQEIFVIMLVVLLLFGADKIPEIAKGIGKGMRDFRKAAEDIRREIDESTKDIRREMSDIGETITRDATEVASNVQQRIDDASSGFSNDIREATEPVIKSADEMAGAVNSDTGNYYYSEPYQNPQAANTYETAGSETAPEIQAEAGSTNEVSPAKSTKRKAGTVKSEVKTTRKKAEGKPAATRVRKTKNESPND